MEMSSINLFVRGLWKGKVYSVVKGKQVIKNYTPPTDPQTAGQLVRRAVFATAVSNWLGFSQAQKNQWKVIADSKGKNLPGYQTYLSDYLKNN